MHKFSQINMLKFVHFKKSVGQYSFLSKVLPIFFTCFWVGAIAKQQLTHPKVSEKKCATGQSCIRERGTTCKIGTLEDRR